MKSICLALVFALAAAAGCGDGDGITVPPPTGTVEVVASTIGTELDPDGYSVRIDDGEPRPIGVAATLTTPEVRPGNHTVQLDGLAANCVVSGPNPQAVVITADATTRAAFQVTCAATTGSIQVAVTTTGSPLDPDGYSVQIDAGAARPIGITATLNTPDVAPGSHTVQLGEIAANCTLSGPNPQTVAVTGGETTTATFEVTCVAAGSVEVVITTTGSAPDADGYLVRVDGGEPQVVGVNATLLIEGLAFGPHTVELSGQSNNCHLDGESIRTFEVVVGSVTAGFAVSCLGAEALIAFASVDLDLEAIFTVRPDGSDLRQLTPGGEFDYEPVWSPDGGKILFGQDVDIYVMNADGSGRMRLVAGRPEAGGYTWSPDGRMIAFTQSGFDGDDFLQELWVMAADGSARRKLSDDGAAPAWSPESRRIAYESGGQIRVINTDGSEDSRLTRQPFGAFQPAWSPDGSQIAFVTTLDEPPNRPAERHIFVANPDGTGLVNLSRGRGDDEGPVWSPDGSRIVFVSTEEGDEDSDIFVMSPSGDGRANLTHRPEFDLQPSWSPDGSKIVFYRFGDEDSEIYIMNADGSGETNISNRPDSRESSPDWGGQGSAVARRQSVTRSRGLKAQELERLRRRR